jgi:hypothetical protein
VEAMLGAGPEDDVWFRRREPARRPSAPGDASPPISAIFGSVAAAMALAVTTAESKVTLPSWCLLGRVEEGGAAAKLLKALADPTRFERATFAFGGQFPSIAAAC